MSKCEQCDGIIPVIVLWEKSACKTFMCHFDVNEFAELTQIWRRFIRHYIPDEVVKSIDGCNFLCTFPHGEHELFVTFCDHQTIKFLSCSSHNCHTASKALNGIVCCTRMCPSAETLGANLAMDSCCHVDVDKVCTFDLLESQNRLTSFIPRCERYEKRVDSISSSSGA